MSTNLLVDKVSEAIDSAAGALFAAQRPDGVFAYGIGSLASTLSTAGAVSALHFADPGGCADLVRRGVDRLVAAQAADGGWSMVPGQESEAGPTAVATAVLQLVAAETAAGRIGAGREWMRRYGGLEAVPHLDVVAWCRQFYSYVGWIDPRDMRRFPLELALLPGLYRRLFDLRAPMVSALALAQTRHKPLTGFQRTLARWAEPNALAVIRQVYEHEGSTGGWCEDAWVTGLIVAGLARAGLGRDMAEAGVRWFREQINPDGSWNSGPLDLTWTMYATRGLLAAGYADDERLRPVKALLLRLQQHEPFTAFGCPPGFWGWSGTRGWPATLETGEIVSVLSRLPGDEQSAAIRDGVGWLTRQQDSRGSWGLCVRNTKVSNSGPCPHMTAQALDGLLDSGVLAGDRRVRRALGWLARAQRPDGSYESVWYRMHTAGTSAVLQTLVRAGAGNSPAAVRARQWLERAQREDGSWSTGRPGDPGTVEETAWAVQGLLAAGADPVSLLPAVRWLLAARLPDGGWPAAPVNEYVRYVSRYPMPPLTQGLALRALSGYRQAVAR